MKHHKRCRNKFGMSFANFGMTAGKFGVAFAALAFLTFSFAACSNDSDNNSSGSDPTPTVKTYTEASEAEKALFTVTYDAEQLAALSHMEQTLTDAITITASVPWTIEEYSDGCYDTWALLSTEESNATTQTTTKITLDIEDNLAEFWAGVTYDENGNPDMSAAQMPDDRTTILHILNAAGKQVAAITLKQTGDNLTSDMITGVSSSNHLFIGHGYDIFKGKWADLSGQSPYYILDKKKMERRGCTIDFQDDTRAEYSIHTGKTFKELTESFDIETSISAKVFKFSGEVKAAYGSDYKESSSEEYGIYSYNARLGEYMVDASTVIDCAVTKRSDGSLQNNYLTDGAYKAIYGLTSTYKGEAGIKNLITNYGTHVIVSGIMGGRRDYYMRIQTTEVDSSYSMEGYLKAGYKSLFSSASVEVDAKYAKKMKEKSSSFWSQIKTVGGNTDVTLSEKDWISALNKNNAALMDFQKNSLVPIWELCTDEKRAKAIEEAVIAYGKTFGN